MNLGQAFILAFIQGITEFFPVSSSGHLVILEHFFHFSKPDLTYDISLHFATLMSIVIYFRKKIISLTKDDLKILFVACLPAGILGLLFDDQIEYLFYSIRLVAITLIFTGILNLLTDKMIRCPTKQPAVKKINYRQALIIGIWQAIAIMPGISRSGSTIFAGIKEKINRQQIFDFSFLLAIPTIIGANLLHLIQIHSISITTEQLVNYSFGCLTAFVVGLISLHFLQIMIIKTRFKFFAYYCFFISIIALLFRFLPVFF